MPSYIKNVIVILFVMPGYIENVVKYEHKCTLTVHCAWIIKFHTNYTVDKTEQNKLPLHHSMPYMVTANIIIGDRNQ